MTTTAPTPELRPNRRRRTIVFVAAAAAIVIALTGVFFPHGNPAAPPAAYGAEVVKVAEANQRLLLDATGLEGLPGRRVHRREGELTLANGDKKLDVHWRPATLYKSYFQDRTHDASEEPIKLLGQNGTLFLDDKYTDMTSLLPPKGPNFVELRGDLGSEAAYRELVGKLKPVGVQEWLDAMPASAVKPADNRPTVDGMLEGLPLPAGFDKTPLYEQTVSNRYQVGARVTGAITCAWLDQWTAAKKSGDTAKVTEAVDAMKTSHSWKILKEMEKQGGYPAAIWQHADEIAKDQAPLEYQQSLGC